MKKGRMSALSLSAAMVLGVCTLTGCTKKEASAEEWATAFNFAEENFTAEAAFSFEGKRQEITARITSDAHAYDFISTDTYVNISRYMYAFVDNVETCGYYIVGFYEPKTLDGIGWAKNKFESRLTLETALIEFDADDFALYKFAFSDFTYGNGTYTAAAAVGKSLDGKSQKDFQNVEVSFRNGKLDTLKCILNDNKKGAVLEWKFSKYGSTKVKFPKDMKVMDE